jgi:hypothetical protein
MEKILLCLIILLLGLALYDYWFSNENFTAPPKEDIMKILNIDNDSPVGMAVSECHSQHYGKTLSEKEKQTFKECLEKAGVESDHIKNTMPELVSKVGNPSPASGDYTSPDNHYNIAENMYNLYSQNAPKDPVNFFDSSNEPYVNGYNPSDKLYSGPNEGFTASGCQQAMMAMSDPYRKCAKTYGYNDFPGYYQCIVTGEGNIG